MLNYRQYELMHLIKGRKLLDAQVFNGTAEIAKTIVTNFFVCIL